MTLQVRRYLAELLGTYILVVVASFTIIAAIRGGGGYVPIAIGFGLALIAGLYAFGPVSGGHFNPAVSLAMLLDKRLEPGDFIGYVVAQVAGAVLASLTVLAVSSREAVAATANALSGIDAWQGFLFEVVATAIFLVVILKASASAGSANTAFLAIGFTLLVIHLALIPFTGTSVNPARSLGPAIVGGVGADLWLFILAPLVGGVVGWVIYRVVAAEEV